MDSDTDLSKIYYVSDALLPGQTAAERPDLVSRVFNLKFRAFCKDLFKNGLLGNVVAHVFVVEFQKRGLPHAHLLATFDKVGLEIKSITHLQKYSQQNLFTNDKTLII